LELAVPVPELVRQIAPWRAGAGNPQHRIDEPAVVGAVPSFVARFAWNKFLNARPLRVRQLPSNQDRLPQLRS